MTEAIVTAIIAFLGGIATTGIPLYFQRRKNRTEADNAEYNFRKKAFDDLKEEYNALFQRVLLLEKKVIKLEVLAEDRLSEIDSLKKENGDLKKLIQK